MQEGEKSPLFLIGLLLMEARNTKTKKKGLTKKLTDHPKVHSLTLKSKDVANYLDYSL